MGHKDDESRDRELVERSQAGDQASFCLLADKYQRRIFDLCCRMLGNRHDAEDLTQEAFLKFHKNIHSYDPGRKLSNWLYTIALNLCRNHLRRRKLVKFFSLVKTFGGESRELDVAGSEPLADEVLIKKDTRAMIEALVMELPPSLKSTFVLHYIHQVGDEEIAGIQGISPVNVRVRLNRARAKLWEGYKKQQGDVTLSRLEGIYSHE